MILISHRGNVSGPNPKMENSPLFIQSALEQGFNVEIDVWYKDKKFYLGHDMPQYEIDLNFLKDNRFWCHAKNIDALSEMMKNKIHCFFHDIDDVVLTSKGYLWTYPGKKLGINSICVESNRKDIKGIGVGCVGICTDYPAYIY